MARNWNNILGPLVSGVALFGIMGLVVASLQGIDIWAVWPLSAVHDWLYTVELGLSGLQVFYLLMGAAFGLAGLSSVRRGVPAFGRAVTLWTKDPIPVRDLHLHDGSVEVVGVAEPIDEYGTIQSRYSGTECLAYRYEEKKSQIRHGRRDKWRVVERGSVRRPFTVTDNTGTVTVDPSGATLTCGRDIVMNSGRLIRTEWRLEPGESVYVSGQKGDGVAGEAPGDATKYIGAGDDPDSFTISDASEQWTILRFLAKGTVLTSLGFLFGGVGVGFLYFFAQV